MPSLINQVQPALEFIPPAFNPTVLRVTQWLLPWWLKYRIAIAQIETENVEVLADLYRQFDLGQTRFLIAFRHPNSPNDAFCLAHLLWQAMPQAAKEWLRSREGYGCAPVRDTGIDIKIPRSQPLYLRSGHSCLGR